MNELPRIVEALLFLSPEPLPVETLADACDAGVSGATVVAEKDGIVDATGNKKPDQRANRVGRSSS